MSWRSYGAVTVVTAGTPVRATANESDPAARVAAGSILFQQVSTNVGKIFILDRQTGNRTTLTGVNAVLAIPTTNILQSASAGVPGAASAFNLADYWIDADNNGERCLVSIVR